MHPGLPHQGKCMVLSSLSSMQDAPTLRDAGLELRNQVLPHILFCGAEMLVRSIKESTARPFNLVDVKWETDQRTRIRPLTDREGITGALSEK